MRLPRMRWPRKVQFSAEAADSEAFESAAAAIHVVNEAGLIVDANRAFELVFGASRRLYLGKHSAILGTEPIAAGLRLLDAIRCAVARHGVWRGTIPSERFNGAAFRARTHAYPMRVGGQAYLVFFQDVVRTPVQAGPAAFRAPVAAPTAAG